ncbi:hypothetical protein Tco_0084002 [Tanacetum coccineum]
MQTQESKIDTGKAVDDALEQNQKCKMTTAGHRFSPNKTTNSNKLVDQKSHTQKPGRQIFTGHRFSPNKTSAVFEKTSPRSDLRWKPTGRIFKSVGLRWIRTGKLFDSCTSKGPYVMSTRIIQSMVAGKDDISETIVKVDSQMMILRRKTFDYNKSSSNLNVKTTFEQIGFTASHHNVTEVHKAVRQ